MWTGSRRRLLQNAGATLAMAPLRGSEAGQQSLQTLREGWTNPPVSCRPHTRWWWPGSAVTRTGITRQLEGMKSVGLGGVEMVVVWRFHDRGNIDYLSPQWFDMVRHALSECERLGMEAALTFSPGWDFGGPWVPPHHRSKVLAPCWQDFQGPFSYEGPLPLFRDFGTPKTGLYNYLAPVEGHPGDQDKVLAVVGARLDGDALVPESLVDLTPDFEGEAGRWRMEEGRWRLTAFRLRYTGQQNSSQDMEDPRSWVVDHLSREAMTAYCGEIASRFAQEFRPWLGRTLDSIFADSFEAVPLANTLLWSNSTLAEFRKRKGYDLRPLLPLLWWNAGPQTPKVRYDVNEMLHQLALEFCFDPFLQACGKLGVQGRMQPHYRFNEEIVAGAGRAHRPETEVTTARFETVADPRKATVSGARFYGREIVSAEAYTFIHRERYRATLEELKIASDAFLRDGVTQFYNHGYLYSESPAVDPSADAPFAERISHWSPWWPHYRGLAMYVARSCFVLRQGRFVADVLLYSPQAQVWSEDCIAGIRQRVMKYGDVPKTLLANGYDYDIVNDDLLQHHARLAGGALELNGHRYRAVLLPAIQCIPLETMQALARFAAAGGLLIALDHAPSSAAGLHAWRERDEEVERLCASVFGSKAHIVDYGFKPGSFSPQEQPYSSTPPLRGGQRRLLELLGRAVDPQLRIGSGEQSDGLTFHQRHIGDVTVFFLTNLQPLAFENDLRFRLDGAHWPESWNPLTGEIAEAADWREVPGGAVMRLRLEPWESTFIVWRPGRRKPKRERQRPVRRTVPIRGPWQVRLRDVESRENTLSLENLLPWNDIEATRHFSGTGTYVCEFESPRADAVLDLGEVGFVAEVNLNNTPLGVRWMRPYRFKIAKKTLKNSRNLLEIRVTNALLAHVQSLPEPSAARHDFIRSAFRRDADYKPLPLSGLKGPVALHLL